MHRIRYFGGRLCIPYILNYYDGSAGISCFISASHSRNF